MEKIKKINSELKKLSYGDDIDYEDYDDMEPDEVSVFAEEFEQVLEQFSEKFDVQFGNIDSKEYSEASREVHDVLNKYLSKF